MRPSLCSWPGASGRLEGTGPSAGATAHHHAGGASLVGHARSGCARGQHPAQPRGRPDLVVELPARRRHVGLGVAERHRDALVSLEENPSGVSRCGVTVGVAWDNSAGRHEIRCSARSAAIPRLCPMSSSSHVRSQRGRGRRRPITRLLAVNTQYGYCSHVELDVRSGERCARASQHSITGRENGHRQSRDVTASCSRAVDAPSERERERSDDSTCSSAWFHRLARRTTVTVRRLESHQVTHDAKHSNYLVSRIFNFVVYGDIQSCL